MARRDVKGTVYLIHFNQRLKHAGHYTGWTEGELDARLATHRAGNGARLMAAVSREGITWQLARTWPDVTRTKERSLKNTGGASRYCPLCGIVPREPKDRDDGTTGIDPG